MSELNQDINTDDNEPTGQTDADPVEGQTDADPAELGDGAADPSGEGEGDEPSIDELTDADLAALQWKYGDKVWTAKDLIEQAQFYENAKDAKGFRDRYLQKMGELDQSYKTKEKAWTEEKAQYQQHIQQANQIHGELQRIKQIASQDPIGYAFGEIETAVRYGMIPLEAMEVLREAGQRLAQMGIYNPHQSQMIRQQVNQQPQQQGEGVESAALRFLNGLDVYPDKQTRQNLFNQYQGLVQSGIQGDPFQLLQLAWKQMQAAKPAPVMQASARRLLDKAKKQTSIRTSRSTGAVGRKEETAMDIFNRLASKRTAERVR